MKDFTKLKDYYSKLNYIKSDISDIDEAIELLRKNNIEDIIIMSLLEAEKIELTKEYEEIIKTKVTVLMTIGDYYNSLITMEQKIKPIEKAIKLIKETNKNSKAVTVLNEEKEILIKEFEKLYQSTIESLQ